MFSEEWPLLLFTLLTQLAVGSYVFFVVIRSLKHKVERDTSINMTRRGMALVGPVMFIALLLSVFHLGDPLGAYRALLNLDSSWLSREILFAGLFFVLWAVGYAMERQGKWNQVVGWINSVVGIAVVFSMASIYASSIMPAWSDFNTYLSFFGTTAVFGAAASVLEILLSKEKMTKPMLSILKVTGMVGALAIALQLIYLPVYSSNLTLTGGAGLESATLISSSFLFPTIIRWTLTIAGVALLVFGVFRSARRVSFYQMSVAAVALVIVGELLGRFLFYATGVPIIVG